MFYHSDKRSTRYHFMDELSAVFPKSRKIKNAATDLAALLMAAVLAGAAHYIDGRSARAQTADQLKYEVVHQATPCYADSVVQGRGPDAILPAGTPIRLIRPVTPPDYKLYETRSGQLCVLSNDAVRQTSK